MIDINEICIHDGGRKDCLLWSNAENPITLVVSKESRMESLKSYEKVLSTS